MKNKEKLEVKPHLNLVFGEQVFGLADEIEEMEPYLRADKEKPGLLDEEDRKYYAYTIREFDKLIRRGDGNTLVRHFDTEGEKKAYLQALEDYDGWNAFYELSDEAAALTKSFKKQ